MASWGSFGSREDISPAYLCSFAVQKLNIKYNKSAKRVIQFDFERGVVTNCEK